MPKLVALPKRKLSRGQAYICARCRQPKPKEMFYKNRLAGASSYCKECYKAYNQERRKVLHVNPKKATRI